MIKTEHYVRNCDVLLGMGLSSLQDVFIAVLRGRKKYRDAPEPVDGSIVVFKRHVLSYLKNVDRRMFLDIDRMLERRVVRMVGEYPDQKFLIRKVHRPPIAVPVPVMQNAGRSIGAINPVGMSNSVALKTAIAESAALHAQREVRAFADTVYKKKVDDVDEIDLCCPITCERFLDPVQTIRGSVYERSAIEEWFSLGHMTDPKTNKRLPTTTLYPAEEIKQRLQFAERTSEVVSCDMIAASSQAVSCAQSHARQ